MTIPQSPRTTPAPRRRTRAERAEHASYARQSVARKRDQDLFRACLWIPANEKERFQQLAAEARARHAMRREEKSAPAALTSAKPGKRHKAKGDPRQGELPL